MFLSRRNWKGCLPDFAQAEQVINQGCALIYQLPGDVKNASLGHSSSNQCMICMEIHATLSFTTLCCTTLVTHTSYVLFEVVLLPFTPWVAMTALKLSPSTRSLYLFFPLCSSMWMTALATSGIPCTTISQIKKTANSIKKKPREVFFNPGKKWPFYFQHNQFCNLQQC